MQIYLKILQMVNVVIKILKIKVGKDKLCPNNKMSHRSEIVDILSFNHQKYSDKAIYLLIKSRTFYFIISISA